MRALSLSLLLLCGCALHPRHVPVARPAATLVEEPWAREVRNRARQARHKERIVAIAQGWQAEIQAVQIRPCRDRSAKMVSLVPVFVVSEATGGTGGGDPPAAPSGVKLTGTSTPGIIITWMDNSSDEAGFTLERSADGSAGWCTVTTTAAGATSYENTGMASGTCYYRVKAVKAGTTCSAWSDVAGPFLF